jgi:uracil-DNA glycosylase
MVVAETIGDLMNAGSLVLGQKRAREEVPNNENERANDMYLDLSFSLSRGDTSPLIKLLTCPAWLEALKNQFAESYFHDLTRFLHFETTNRQVFPEISNVFRALNLCPLSSLKVVILGQDPYHDDGQAMGLSFSVPPGHKLPSSLLNIYKELETDLEIPRRKSGDLTPWAERGVLLLNSCLTVRAHSPNSHADRGWEKFTDAIVRVISARAENCVFLLWGKFAEKKGGKVDPRRHLILKSAHPSGLSASRGFFGCKHFSEANAYLEANHPGGAVDWALD